MVKVMIRKIIYIGFITMIITSSGCKLPVATKQLANTNTPESFNENAKDTLNIAQVKWRDYFKDSYLIKLIDQALTNNQELNIVLQEIQLSRNDIKAKKGEYLPFVGLSGGISLEKTPRYTRFGANDANTDITSGEQTPDPLPDYMIGARATWEVDIWGKLHKAKKAAVMRYLSSVQGKNFMVTNLVAEIADLYYELLALDNQLNIVKQNILIQSNALKNVKLQKMAAKVTELAVKRFEAQLLKTKSAQYTIQQKIIQTENRINYLVGRYPQPIERRVMSILDVEPPQVIGVGVPSQLLENRPDVKRAELDLEAAKLDVKVAKANFYPSLRISADLGYRAFNLSYILKPESLLATVTGELAAPLINRNAIKATYANANARQVQAIYNYERILLKAYIEVVNQLAKIDNLNKSYELQSKQVDALTRAINISNNLFRSARANYIEVLTTQGEAIKSRFELVETKMKQMKAVINTYRALGGGWN